MHSLKDLLSGNLKRNRADRAVRAVVVLDACREALESVLPAQAADKARAVSYKDGIITLSVPHSAIAEEIRRYQRRIINLIEERRGKGIVRFIRIRVGWQDNKDMLT